MIQTVKSHRSLLLQRCIHLVLGAEANFGKVTLQLDWQRSDLFELETQTHEALTEAVFLPLSI